MRLAVVNDYEIVVVGIAGVLWGIDHGFRPDHVRHRIDPTAG